MMKALLGDDGNGGYTNYESFHKAGYVFSRGKRGMAAVLGSSSQNSDTWLLITMVSLLGSPYASNCGTPSKWLLFLAYKWGVL